MALTDAVHRKVKTDEENIKDFYQSPYACTEALIAGLQEIETISEFYGNGTVFEPCAGEGAIVHVLNKYFDNVIANDLFYDNWDYHQDFLTMKSIEDVNDGLIILNPPYSKKNAFIDKAMELGGLVAVILPSNVDNYTIMNENYFSKPSYLGSIRTFPKFFMNDNLDKIKYGGMSTYMWALFSKNEDCQEECKQRFDIRKDIRKYIDLN